MSSKQRMFARISTVFDCTEEAFWEAISKPASLQFVASPVLSFRELVKGELGGEWVIGKTYSLKLYFLNIVPLGLHRIKLVTMDRKSKTIVSCESGFLSPVWNHTIRFRQIGKNKLRYTDEIEIGAGWLTVAIWAFAHLFYRHRQRRWRILLKNPVVCQNSAEGKRTEF